MEEFVMLMEQGVDDVPTMAAQIKSSKEDSAIGIAMSKQVTLR
jgi:hypothetical protein